MNKRKLEQFSSVFEQKYEHCILNNIILLYSSVNSISLEEN